MASGITWTVTYTVVSKDGQETPGSFTNADISTVRRHYRAQREEASMAGGSVKNGNLSDSNGNPAPLQEEFVADGQWTITFTYKGFNETMSGRKDVVIARYQEFKNSHRTDATKITNLKMTNPDGREVDFNG